MLYHYITPDHAHKMPAKSRFHLLALAAAALSPTPATAQDQGTAPHTHDLHDDEATDVIVVTAGGLQRLDMLAGTSVVEGAELQRNMSGQVGEVLAQLPGVSASGFAPGASRPVLRGFSGERVRVLVDGIGSIDASNTSADHAVTIDPLTAESIEVLRGPAVLLYGSSAIGGAVNVIDRRIPHSKPHGGLRFDGVLSGDTASDLREVGASLDVVVAPGLVWHGDGSFRKTNDLEVSGFTLSDDLRADLLAQNDPQLTAAAEQRDVLPSSATRTTSLGSGLTWFSGQNSIGGSVSYYDTLYGVPIAPGGEEGPVSIALEQFRADLRGEFHISDGLFHDLVTRWGYSDYTHSELEGDEIGTTFQVEGVEGRVELIQSEQALGDGILHGSIGGQFFTRDFVAIGAEAFVPPNSSQQLALFALEELRFGPFEAELGARYESTRQHADVLNVTRSFDTVSGALGLSWSFDSGVRTGLNLSRATRAPATEELFADGPHVATSQYELGDPALTTEAAWGAEAYVRAAIGGADLRLAVYQNWFEDFIYLFDTGLEQDDLPLQRYLQQDANWFGIEAEASAPLAKLAGGTMVGDLRGSFVRATLDDGTPVPRIPPLSGLAALEWQSDAIDLRGEVEWFDAQNRVSPGESPSDGFAHVNLSLSYRPFDDQLLTVMLQADNVFDAEGRRHASYTKLFVPLAGRNIRLSLRTRL